jgi:6-phosphogluconate dehydrogenase
MSNTQYEFGVMGMGTMGRNLLLNMADHGFSVVGYNKSPQKIELLKEEAKDKPNVYGTIDLKEFVQKLQKPRAIMMLVTAGPAVDEVINELLPILDKGDIIIDGGNSFHADTERRAKDLLEKGFNFMGVGVSGGEEGARFGPSIMPGGTQEGYAKIKNVLEAVSAKVNGEPCVAYLGRGSAGHYVKMVHNGIEYGIMQMLAESYDILKRGLGLTNEELYQVYDSWNKGRLQSFLVEITADVFLQNDDKGGSGKLIDKILDKAGKKGTGKWTSKEAFDLQVPLPTIDMSVTMRDMSGFKDERVAASKVLTGPTSKFSADKQVFINQVEEAFYASMIISYAQGLVLLKKASQEYNFNLNLGEVAKIWRGGCIIRATMLEPIREAFAKNANLPNLMVDSYFAAELNKAQSSLRAVIKAAIDGGIPAPCFMTALSYFDAYRTDRLPANLIQAQRDKFGAHTYERVDQEGVFHTNWNQ